MALQDEATPGLSLIEVTNGFNLVVADREHPRTNDAVAALALAVHGARARAGPALPRWAWWT